MNNLCPFRAPDGVGGGYPILVSILRMDMCPVSLGKILCPVSLKKLLKFFS